MSAPALVKVETGVERADPFDFTRQQIDLIKATVLPGANDLELDFFLNWCRVKGLDPLSGEAYAIRQGGKLQPAAQIAGMRKIAARSGEYGPQDGPYWCGQDGAWTDVWLQDAPPAAAKVGVKRTGHDAYTYAVALWNEHGKNKAGRGGPWAVQPAHMLAIRAEAAALRRVFPTDLGGVYTKDELSEEPAFRTAKPVMVEVEIAGGEMEFTDDSDIIDGETGEILPVETLQGVKREIQGMVKEAEYSNEDLELVTRSLEISHGWRELTLEEAQAIRDDILERTAEDGG